MSDHTLFSGKQSKASDLGAPIIRTASTSKVRHYKNMAFWAEGGRIYIEDERTGEFETCSIRDFGQRVLTLAEMAMHEHDGHERKLLVKMTGDARDVIYQAKEQGDPHNPHVLAFKLRQRGRKTSVGGIRSYPDSVVKEGPVKGGISVGKPWPKLDI